MKATYSSVVEYVEKNPDALDDHAKTGLKACDARVSEFITQRQSTKRARVDTMRKLDLATDDLRRSVIQSRKALEGFAVVERKPPLTPRATAGMWLVSRIYNIAVKHQEALAGVSGDAVIDRAAAALKAAMERFSKALSESDAQQVAWKNLTHTINEEVAVMAGKLVGYKQFAVYNMPSTERRNLRDQIRSVVQSKTHHKKAGDGAEDAPAATETPTVVATMPALPTMPTFPTGTTELRRDGVTSPTAVPPSSEHPASGVASGYHAS